MWICFVVAASVLLLDQVSKFIVEMCINEGVTHNIIGNFFYISKEYNTGAAWSSFADNTVMLVCISLIASVLLSLIIIKTVKNFNKMKLYSISLGFMLGGTFGNLVDRFLTTINERKGVIDMIGVRFGSYNYPVFNLADSFLVVGVILLIIDMLFLSDKRKGDK